MKQVSIASDWLSAPAPEDTIFHVEKAWHFSLPEGLGADELMSEFARLSGKNLLSSFGTLVAICSLLVPISLFAIIGGALYDVFKEAETPVRIYQVLISAMLAYVLLAVLAARSGRLLFLSQELGTVIGGFQDIAKRLQHHPNRILRLARKWADIENLAMAERVDIWNPNYTPADASIAAQKSLFWTVLLPLLREKLNPACRVVLHVRHDEVANLLQCLSKAGLSVDTQVIEPINGIRQATGEDFLTANERPLLRLLRISCFPVEAITANVLGQAVGSQCFSENYFLHLTSWLLQGSDQGVISRFLSRCRDDYGYLDEQNEFDILSIPAQTDATIFLDCQNFSARAQQLLVNDIRRFVNDHDPLSYLATINALASLHDAQHANQRFQENLKEQIKTLTVEAIAILEHGEYYPLFSRFAHNEFSDTSSNNQLANYLPRVIELTATDSLLQQAVFDLTRFNAFDTETLIRLARMLEVCGFYRHALAIWSKLSLIDPLRAEIRRARLLERLGEAVQGFKNIDSLITSNQLACRPELHIEALLEGSWLCYSTQNSSLAPTGTEWLDAAKALLNEHIGHNIQWWRYHNYRALYLDASKRYAEALAENQKALAIPGVNLKWYSGSLVNLSYVSRKNALSEHATGSPKVAIDQLLAAIEYANLAVTLKKRIGDRDELPVALHNQSLANICLAMLGQAEEKSVLAEHARSAAEQGLQTLLELGSTKKQLALSLERTLALWLLEQDWTEALAAAEAAPMNSAESAILGKISASAALAPRALADAVLKLEILD